MGMWSLLLLNCLFGYKWHLCLSIGTGFTSHFALSRQVAPENTNNSNNQYLLKYFSKHFMNKNPFNPWGENNMWLNCYYYPPLTFYRWGNRLRKVNLPKNRELIKEKTEFCGRQWWFTWKPVQNDLISIQYSGRYKKGFENMDSGYHTWFKTDSTAHQLCDLIQNP